MKIRNATTHDAKSIQKLINHYANKEEMLAKSLNDIYENIQEYFVIGTNKKMIACGALHVSWEDLAEIKSLAINEKYQKKGFGKKIVAACEKRAKELGVKTVFALTFKPEFFEKIKYSRIPREQLPHKVWGECVKCPKFPDCGEVPVLKKLK